MGRRCSVCAHRDCEAIDRAIVGGEPCRAIAARSSLSPDAVERHAQHHLPAAIVKAQAAAEVVRGDELFDQVKRQREKAEDLYAEARAVLRRAKRRREPELALAAVRSACVALRELRQQVELLANLGKAEDTAALEAKIAAFERRLGGGLGAP